MKKIFYSLVVLASVFTMSSCQNDCCCCQKKEMGIQLYSVRSHMDKYAEEHDSVFASLSRAGYTYIEAASYDWNNHKFYGVSPEQFKEDLAKYGLRAMSSHTGKGISYDSMDFTEALKAWEGAIADHKAAGMEYIVVPGIGMPKNLDEMNVLCAYFNAIGKLCAENGIKFGYHNHSHEFVQIDGKNFYDYMIENTDPKYVFFEMDVYWAVMAKASPVDYFNKYPGRFKVLHIKDRREVGQSGMVGFDAIFGASKTAGLEKFIVELEGSIAPEILDGCAACAKYLKQLPAVKASYPEAE